MLGYYLIVVKNDVYTFMSHDNEPLKADDNSWYRIKITQDDYNMYLQALKDNKEIYVDDDGKIQTRYKLKN